MDVYDPIYDIFVGEQATGTTMILSYYACQLVL